MKLATLSLLAAATIAAESESQPHYSHGGYTGSPNYAPKKGGYRPAYHQPVKQPIKRTQSAKKIYSPYQRKRSYSAGHSKQPHQRTI